MSGSPNRGTGEVGWKTRSLLADLRQSGTILPFFCVMLTTFVHTIGKFTLTDDAAFLNEMQRFSPEGPPPTRIDMMLPQDKVRACMPPFCISPPPLQVLNVTPVPSKKRPVRRTTPPDVAATLQELYDEADLIADPDLPRDGGDSDFGDDDIDYFSAEMTAILTQGESQAASLDSHSSPASLPPAPSQ